MTRAPHPSSQDASVEADPYYEALAQSLGRYHGMAVAAERRDLWEFIEQLQDEIANRAPLYKLNRWLGYIQGVLIEIGQTDVLTERDWTRPLFRPLDFPAPTSPTGEAKTAEPAAEVDLCALEWTYMPSYGRMSFLQLREAVAEVNVGDRHHLGPFDPTYHAGHQQVGGCNYNSLNRIVTAFVQVALASHSADAEALRAEVERLTRERDEAREELTAIANNLGCIDKPGFPLKFVETQSHQLRKAHAREVDLIRSWDPASPTERQELDRLRRGWGPSTPSERQARHSDLISAKTALSMAMDDVTTSEDEDVAEEAIERLDAAYESLNKGYVRLLDLLHGLGDVEADAESRNEAIARADEALARLADAEKQASFWNDKAQSLADRLADAEKQGAEMAEDERDRLYAIAHGEVEVLHFFASKEARRFFSGQGAMLPADRARARAEKDPNR